MISITISLTLPNPPEGYEAQKELAERARQWAINYLIDFGKCEVSKSESTVSRYVEREEIEWTQPIPTTI